MTGRFNYYEFFAGTGMARAGLGHQWRCTFANDCDELKTKFYIANWGNDHFDGRDVALVPSSELTGLADLAWSSFPCQDLSQAGAKRGIGVAGDEANTRSGAVWPFLKLMRELAAEGRHPVLLALENVVGLLTANSGADFRAICSALSELGYRFGAVVLNATLFVPQSRPRVFIVAMRNEVLPPSQLRSAGPVDMWCPPVLLRAHSGLSSTVSANWVWWRLGNVPAERALNLSDVIDIHDKFEWNSDEATDRLLSMMAPPQQQRLIEAKLLGRPVIGSLYLRMRSNGDGGTIQRAEISFGESLGCLRTPKGGASRPRIIVVNGAQVRTRLLSPSEAARVMGLDENFVLPQSYHEAFRLIGDGVVPQVVRFLSNNLLEPLASHANAFLPLGETYRETA